MSGRIVPYNEICSNTKDEMRVMTIRNYPGLPDGDYALLDSYCVDPKCDCRVAYIFVMSKRKHMASINFGWESLDFYRKWMGYDEVDDTIRDLKGPALMLMAPQTKYASILFELVRVRLDDPNYVQRLKRHYKETRKALSSRKR